LRVGKTERVVESWSLRVWSWKAGEMRGVGESIVGSQKRRDISVSEFRGLGV